MSKQVTHLLRIMSRLRSPTGCPWDREQNHKSLIRCLKDETEELIHVIRKGDIHGLREELGDLLLQVIFHAQLANEAGKFSFNDVVRTITRKLIRRHPHVFSKRKVHDVAGVLKQWNEIKAKEKKDQRHARNRRYTAVRSRD